MSDWNDIAIDRDGLPRGYALFDPYAAIYEPLAPPNWVAVELYAGETVDETIQRCRDHARIVGRVDPMDVRVLAERYTIVPARAHAIAPLCCCTLSIGPLDAFAEPVALAAKVSFSRPDLKRRAEAWITAVSIDGYPQEDWLQPWIAPWNVRPHLSTADMDRGRAWFARWGIFTSLGLGHPLVIELGNPSDEHAVDVELFVFCTTYDSVPR